MARDILLLVGGLVLLASTASGAVKSVGAPRTLFTLATLSFVVAGSLLVANARDRHRFRVTDLRLLAPQYSGPCPAAHRVLVAVATAGGDGEVALRIWADEEPDVEVQTVKLGSGGSAARAEVVATVAITKPGFSTAFASTESPSRRAVSTSFRVFCEQVVS